MHEVVRDFDETLTDLLEVASSHEESPKCEMLYTSAAILVLAKVLIDTLGDISRAVTEP